MGRPHPRSCAPRCGPAAGTTVAMAAGHEMLLSLSRFGLLFSACTMLGASEDNLSGGGGGVDGECDRTGSGAACDRSRGGGARRCPWRRRRRAGCRRAWRRRRRRRSRPARRRGAPSRPCRTGWCAAARPCRPRCRPSARGPRPRTARGRSRRRWTSCRWSRSWDAPGLRRGSRGRDRRRESSRPYGRGRAARAGRGRAARARGARPSRSRREGTARPGREASRRLTFRPSSASRQDARGEGSAPRGSRRPRGVFLGRVDRAPARRGNGTAPASK